MSSNLFHAYVSCFSSVIQEKSGTNFGIIFDIDTCAPTPITVPVVIDELIPHIAKSPIKVPTLCRPVFRHLDRKSTRLNSSHVKISYAVFCLKKKKTLDNTATC